MGILTKLAALPTRLWEYAALLALVAGGVWWFVSYEQDIGEKRILDRIAKQQIKTQDAIDKTATPQNAAVDARYHALDEALKRYEATTPAIAAITDCVAPADVVRAVNAAHQTGRK